MNTKQTGYVKIGLVVVLAIVFVGVLGNSLLTVTRSSATPPPPPRRNQPAPAATQHQPTALAAPAPAVAPQQTAQAEASHRVWPKFELAEIIAYDPFAIAKPNEIATALKSTASTSADRKEPTGTPTGDTAAAKNEPDPGFSGRIHAVYQRGGKTAALIGSKTVRPGDQLEGAGRIVDVDQGGLMLELHK